MRQREEVPNTLLALQLERLGSAAQAETIHLSGRHRPDVLLHLSGMRIVLEGKYADVPNAQADVFDRAQARHVTVTKVAALVLANALIFQERLAVSVADGRIETLHALRSLRRLQKRRNTPSMGCSGTALMNRLACSFLCSQVGQFAAGRVKIFFNFGV